MENASLYSRATSTDGISPSEKEHIPNGLGAVKDLKLKVFAGKLLKQAHYHYDYLQQSHHISLVVMRMETLLGLNIKLVSNNRDPSQSQAHFLGMRPCNQNNQH